MKKKSHDKMHHKKEHHGKMHHEKKHDKKQKEEASSHHKAKHSSHAKPKHHEKHSDDHKKNFIAGAIKHPGALRKELHVKKGHKIPVDKLKKAAHAKGKEGRRGRLAMTLRKLGHRKHKKGE